MYYHHSEALKRQTISFPKNSRFFSDFKMLLQVVLKKQEYFALTFFFFWGEGAIIFKFQFKTFCIVLCSRHFLCSVTQKDEVLVPKTPIFQWEKEGNTQEAEKIIRLAKVLRKK